MSLYGVIHGENVLESFAESILPSKATTHNIVTKLLCTRSLVDEEQSRKSHVVSEGKLDDISTRLEASPMKSSRLLALQ
jgi:hypothetical protein